MYNKKIKPELLLSEKAKALIQENNIVLNKDGSVDVSKIKKLLHLEKIDNFTEVFNKFKINNSIDLIEESYKSKKIMIIIFALSVVFIPLLSLGLIVEKESIKHTSLWLSIMLAYMIWLQSFYMGKNIKKEILNLSKKKVENFFIFKQLEQYFLMLKALKPHVEFNEELFKDLTIYKLKNFPNIFIQKQFIVNCYKERSKEIKRVKVINERFFFGFFIILFICIFSDLYGQINEDFKIPILVGLISIALFIIVNSQIKTKKHRARVKALEHELSINGIKDIEEFEVLYLYELQLIVDLKSERYFEKMGREARKFNSPSLISPLPEIKTL